MNGHPDRGEERLRQPACGDPRGGLSGAGALEHVAHVGMSVPEQPGEVRVPRPRGMNFVDCAVDRPRFIRSSQFG